jgi:hypothetical protein
LRRVHLTPAMGVSLAALVVAASGGAYAAVTGSSGAIVACVHQKGGGLYIARKCARHDKRLKWSVTGPRGPAGRDGAIGPAGLVGPKGNTGAPGPFPGVLPRGITVRGNWVAGSSVGNTGTAYASISFGFAFASAPTFNYVPGPASVPAGCSGGTSGNPTAQPGNLCLYLTGWALNTIGATPADSNAWGALFAVKPINSSLAFGGQGTWAATSP